MLRFGDLPVAIHWIDLPGIARYEMEFALYAPDRRVTLSFPSPFLRNEPAVLEIEGGERGHARGPGGPRRPSPTPAASRPSWWRSTTARSAAPRRSPRGWTACGTSRCARRSSSATAREGRSTTRPVPGGRRDSRGEHRAGADGQPIAVANAPVSYGAFEITVGHDPNVPDGISVLDQVAAAGYAGIDLGPVGYLGSGTRLGELLAERGLGLAGGYLELPYADHDALEQAHRASWTPCWPRSTRCGRTCPGRRRGRRWPTPAAGSAAAGPAGPPRSLALGLDADGWRSVRRGPGPGGGPLPRPRLRADLPPGDRHLRRGAVGDRGGARPVRHRALPGDRAHDAGRRRPGGHAQGLGRTASTTCT